MRQATIILAILAIPVLAHATTLKVPSQYPTIQDAINASVNGDTVLVAPGTYVENIDYKGKAITVKSMQGQALTIIDGNYAGSVVTCRCGEGPDSVLNGFSLVKGLAVNGGGMFNEISSPTVSNCTFSDNSSYLGGGIYYFQSNSTVTHCTFIGNMACDYGGGMAIEGGNPVASYCIFYGNSADSGGGISNSFSSPTVTNCIFRKNVGQYSGGGMFNFRSHPTVTHCSFTGNLVGFFGSGMANLSSNPTVMNSIFSGNSAGSGGGVSNDSGSPTVTNCTFFGNEAFTHGGGIFNGLECNPTVTNTVLWNNDAPEGPEIWIGVSSFPSTFTISYSDVKGGKASVHIEPYCTLDWGSGMIEGDPLFVDETDADFHLTCTSPCKDTGDNTAITEPNDFEGDPRIAYGTVDMGADEFYTHLYWTGDAAPGGAIEFKLVGLPGTKPVGLCIGTGVLDPPLPSMWGDWYLQFPIIGPVDLGMIPSPDGVLVIPGTIPGLPPPPYSIPMQALIGGELSNLCVMEVN